MQTHAEVFLNSRLAAAEIAIFHSLRTAILATGEGNESPIGTASEVCTAFFWQSGLSADILVAEQLLSRDLKRYKVIYLPFAYTLSREEGARLKEYVESGGTLYAELGVV